jgi:hypothetical protein
MCMSVTFGHTLALREGGYTVQKVTVQFTPRSTFVEASVMAGKALSTPADAGDFAFSGGIELPDGPPMPCVPVVPHAVRLMGWNPAIWDLSRLSISLVARMVPGCARDVPG